MGVTGLGVRGLGFTGLGFRLSEFRVRGLGFRGSWFTGLQGLLRVSRKFFRTMVRAQPFVLFFCFLFSKVLQNRLIKEYTLNYYGRILLGFKEYIPYSRDVGVCG